MKEKMILAGFGGQGIMFIGKLLCYTEMHEGKHVTYIPSYGAEMRGGTANCSVILSDMPIAAPMVTGGTTVVIMNQPSFEKFKDRVVAGGFLFVNSSLVDVSNVRKDITLVEVPATEIASSSGDSRNANMIMLGVMNYIKHFMNKETLFKQFPGFLGKKKMKLLDSVKEGFEEGEEYAKQHFTHLATPVEVNE